MHIPILREGGRVGVETGNTSRAVIVPGTTIDSGGGDCLHPTGNSNTGSLQKLWNNVI